MIDTLLTLFIGVTSRDNFLRGLSFLWLLVNMLFGWVAFSEAGQGLLQRLVSEDGSMLDGGALTFWLGVNVCLLVACKLRLEALKDAGLEPDGHIVPEGADAGPRWRQQVIIWLTTLALLVGALSTLNFLIGTPLKYIKLQKDEQIAVLRQEGRVCIMEAAPLIMMEKKAEARAQLACAEGKFFEAIGLGDSRAMGLLHELYNGQLTAAEFERDYAAAQIRKAERYLCEGQQKAVGGDPAHC